MISEELLEQVIGVARQGPLDDSLVAKLRSRFNGLHFTFCQDDDVVGSPVAETGLFNVYLVDSSDHCLRLTSEMATASGLVIAERYAG